MGTAEQSVEQSYSSIVPKGTTNVYFPRFPGDKSPGYCLAVPSGPSEVGTYFNGRGVGPRLTGFVSF
jgi:hypothetical protein